MEEELRNNREFMKEARQFAERQAFKDALLQKVRWAADSEDDDDAEDASMYVSEELRADRDLMLELVRLEGICLQYASEDLRADKQVVLEAVRQNGRALEFASPELQSDKEVVLEAVSQDGFGMRFASKVLCADKEVMLEAVSRFGLCLQFASDELQADRDVALKAVQQQGSAFPFASNGLRADRQLVLEAVRRDANARFFACPELKDDKEVLFATARSLRRDDKNWRRSWVYQDALGKGISEGAITSAIAACGETAPVVSITLPPEAAYLGDQNSSSSNNNSNSNNINNNSSSNNAEATLKLEVALLSGATFSCSLTDCSGADEFGTNRPGPTLNDVAKAIVKELALQGKVTSKASDEQQRVFMNFIINDDGDALAVSPLDWDRPLLDFVTSSRPS